MDACVTMSGTMTGKAPPALARRLTLRDLVVYGLLFIGPLAPVGVFGVLDAQSDGAVASVYALATLAMAFTAWSYAEMSRVVPHAGSVFAYASEGLGRGAGFLAGWMAMLDYLLIPSVALLFSGLALHSMAPAIPTWVFVVAAFALTTGLNLAGVGVAARAGFVVLVGEVAVLLIFVGAALVVLTQEGPARPWLEPFTGSGGFHLPAIVSAISVAVLSFLGFDAIASFAEENASDPRQVGRAIVFCLIAAGILFVVQTWLAALLNPVGPIALAADRARQGTAFYDLTRAAIGPWLATLLAVTKAIGPVFAAMVAQAAAARLLYGMARDGGLPRRIAEVDARSRVPRTAVITTGAITLIVSVWAARQADGLAVLVSIVDVGALTAFALLHLAVVGYFVVRGRAPSRATHIMWPAAGVVVTIWVMMAASLLAQVVGAAWAMLGLLVWLSRRAPGLRLR
jgi:amino acid transporter